MFDYVTNECIFIQFRLKYPTQLLQQNLKNKIEIIQNAQIKVQIHLLARD